MSRRTHPVGFNPTETIETAAINVDGEVWTLPRPTRHWILIRAWCDAHWRNGKPASIPVGHIQGFITSFDNFVGRREAAKIAYKAGQIDREKNALFSEDLW